jgi:butyryl-CoA dehydrogenase
VAIVIEEIGRACASTCTTYAAHLSLAVQFINMFGTEGQKRQFIPPLVTGKSIAAFALTEPGAGSDAAAIQTSATQSNGSYIINGTKTYITNAPEADIFVFLATVDRNLGTKGIIPLIMERDTPGLTINPLHGKMGIRASSTAEVVFDNCAVPVENRLGNEGEGFRSLMQMLNQSRISIAAQCIGVAQASYDAALKYAQERRAFGQRIADFQGLQWMLVDMATATEAARLLVHKAATLRDAGQPFATEASMAKLYGSRVAVENADKAVQIHGGAGYFAPSDVERYYRDAKIMEIYEGTSEIQRLIIARNIIPRE